MFVCYAKYYELRTTRANTSTWYSGGDLSRSAQHVYPQVLTHHHIVGTPRPICSGSGWEVLGIMIWMIPRMYSRSITASVVVPAGPVHKTIPKIAVQDVPM